MSANGSRQVEESSGPFDPDKLPALEDLRKHLDWFLKVDEVLVPKKCFSDNLSDSIKNKSKQAKQLELVVYGGAPKNFFNWVNRAVGGR